MDTRVLVGKIGAPHGVKGQLRVFSYTDPMENILEYQPWHFKRQGQDFPLKVLKVQNAAKMLIVQFEGITNPEEAAKLTHIEIFVDRDKLPSLEKDEYYWSDLTGLSVTNLDGYCLGRVTHLMSTGGSDVMFIEGEKSHCLPYSPDSVIKKIDLEKKEMLVDWPTD